MQEITLINLITKTKGVLKQNQYRQSTLSQFDYALKGLYDYFNENNTIEFSVTLATQYVIEARRRFDEGNLMLWKLKLIRRIVALLIEYYETNSIHWRKMSSWKSVELKIPLYVSVITNYVRNLEDKGYGLGTIKLRKTVTKKFLTFLEESGAHDLFLLKPNTISHFILYASKDYQPISMGTVCAALRSFFSFLTSANLISTDLTLAIPSGFARKTLIVPTISHQEEDQMLSAIDRNTPIGKRDYAILLIALRLGLRSVDITNLKLEQLKWQRNTLEMVQQKTGRLLIVPLLADVGNAIIEYLLNGRPTSSEPYVFLRNQAPYTKLSGNIAVYHIVSGYMKKAGIRQDEGDRKGAHCLRHSVAARLLAAETPLPIISSVLGQADKNSARVYLSTDMEHLQSCALGLAGIEVVKEELQS